MTEVAQVLDLTPLGARVEITRTSAETDGELLEFVVAGRPRGFLARPHVHTRQSERFEVLSGSLELQRGGETHTLLAGDTIEVPPGTVHRQRPGGADEGRVRVQVRPAGTTHEFLVRLEEMCAARDFLRGGWPRPLAAAALVRDFGDEGHAAQPPLRVQKALARILLGATSREYLFVDEWNVAAPREATFNAIADARTYPEWWRPVYIDVDAEGPPAVGRVSSQHFKGRLPYELRTRSKIVELAPPAVVAAEVEGDLRGYGRWTLTPIPSGTHVRFDWHVYADRRLLRVLTPVLRPAFRWNHNWAIARAVDGLEPYARRTSAAAEHSGSAAPTA
jgi:mannose-6-phosphate isomerase-like protein (cupin superfamily)